MEYITVIGSRKITPEEEMTLILFGRVFQQLGFTLRSGGAGGADNTVTHYHRVEIFIPWNGFNNLHHDGERIFSLDKLPDVPLAIKKMESIHPAADKLTQGARKLHTRNIYQVIGKNGANGQKSCLVLYCSDEDIMTNFPVGGTRTAVLFAKDLGIPTINIRTQNINLEDLLGKMKYTSK